MGEAERTETDPAVAGLVAEASRSWDAGHLDHAVRLYKSVLHDHPRHAGALHDLGCLLGQVGRAAEARALLERAIEVDDRRSESFVFLANALVATGRSKDAATRMEQALALAPDDAWAQASGAACLARCNRLDDAEAAAKRALELEPDHALASVILAGLELRGGRTAEARARLEPLLAAGRLAGELRRRAFFHLGRALDRQGEHNAAFEVFQRMGRAAEQDLASARIDRAVWPRLVRAYREGLSPDLFADRAAPPPADGRRAPAFLVGFPRSGTTLTEQVLAAHPAVVTTDEHPTMALVRQRVAALAGPGGDPATAAARLSPNQLGELRTLFWSATETALGEPIGDRQLVDKLPLNIVGLGLINIVFPDARIIVALRDPRDVCLSCFFQDFGLNEAMIHFNTLDSTAAMYEQVMGLWLHQKEAITLPFIEIRYEDTVRDLEPQARRLIDHLGLPWDDAILTFHERAADRVISTPSFEAVTEPVHTRAIGRWKNYRKHFEPVIETLAPFVREFGYEAESG